MDAKERMDEVQIAANEVLWAASRLKDSAMKEAAERLF